jgi:6-phosphofructokinase 1
MGVKAIDSLLKNKTQVMTGIKNNKMALTPLIEAVKGKSKIDSELLRISDIMSI